MVVAIVVDGADDDEVDDDGAVLDPVSGVSGEGSTVKDGLVPVSDEPHAANAVPAQAATASAAARRRARTDDSIPLLMEPIGVHLVL
ncbi:hypothetical protein GCM10023147_34000 [Tsukamurella soli]|uniref:Uncharacterized protein n=1 Tax=Tsukamurella soli TaxID=644556 RepID=A0ABP8JYX7_9ACTN